MYVARFLANGTALDGTFGGGSGRVRDQAVANMHNRAYGLALLRQREILVGAECGSATCGARYNRTARWTRRSPPVASLARRNDVVREPFRWTRAGF